MITHQQKIDQIDFEIRRLRAMIKSAPYETLLNEVRQSVVDTFEAIKADLESMLERTDHAKD